MIIRCRKCDTRFRFDETLIEGDGVWVRCSRCQNVFFEERPSGEPRSSAPAGSEIPSVRISDAVKIGDATHIPDDRFPSADDRPPRAEREATSVTPPYLAEADDEVPVEIGKESSLEGIEGDMDKEPLSGPTAAADEEMMRRKRRSRRPNRQGEGGDGCSCGLPS